MLAGFLVLWQGIGWAATQYEYELDGYNYAVIINTNGTKYARLKGIPTGVETIHVPSDILYEGENYKVTQVQLTTRRKDVKHIYFTRAIANRNLNDDGTFRGEFADDAIIHTPDSLYEKALVVFGSKYTVTDGTRTGSLKDSFSYVENGITYKIYPNASYATIVDFSDEEIVKFPAEITCSQVTYPVTRFEYSSTKPSHGNLRDIYFTTFFKEDINCKRDAVTAHVPENLWEQAIADGGYGKVTDGKRLALYYTIHSIKGDGYAPEYFYDVDGDGNMEVFGSGSRTDNNGYYYSLMVSTTKGDVLRNSGSFKDKFQMGMYDKEGVPLIIENDPLKVYSYAENKYLLVKEGVKNTTQADINGDGRIEILPGQNYGYSGINWQSPFYRMTKDGTFIADKLYATSDTTIVESRMLDDYTPNSNLVSKSSGGGVPSLMDGMFVEAKQNPGWTDWQEYNNITPETSQAKQVVTSNGVATYSMTAPTGYVTASDVNGDGMVDLSDGSNIYYNLGANKFFKSPHKGTVYSADLTGNGLLDFIDFGDKQVDLYLNMAENSDMQMKTLLKNTAITNTFFGDFDKDGDVDILFIIPGNGYTIFQFYRNDGNGVFKPKDTDTDGSYTCIACNDYDGDGLYEILAQNNDIKKKNYVLFKLNKNWTVTTTNLTEGTYPFVKAIGDLNNDGKMELVTGYRYYIYQELPNCKTNTRPEKMEKPSAVTYADAGKLKISWTRGKDAETSACDLTYELRIGSESGKGDIFLGKSNADGTRRALEDGNMGRALKYMFDTNNLSEGKYYIAIQAIDAGGLGGPWSEELIYEHKVAVPSINTIGQGYCVADTITLTVQNPRNDATYDWNLSNGTIISQNDNGSIIDVIFERAGKQTATVSMLLGGQAYKSESKIIADLVPAKYTELPVSDNRALASTYFLDLNQDGNVAVFGRTYNVKTSEYEHGWFEYKDGIYNKVRKTWNSDLVLSNYAKMFFADFNHDGYPDFYLSDQSKGNLFINSGEEDNSYEYDTEEFSLSGNYITADLNNDGRLNFLSGDVASDERNFKQLDLQEQIGKSYPDGFYDFNRDGGLDVWANTTNSGILKQQTKVYLKKAGENYQYETTGKVFYENDHRYTMVGFADFNNDGYVDGYYFDKPEGKDYYNMVIVKGKPMNEWPCTQTVVIPIKSNYNVALLDFDNNGYIDIYTDGTILLMDKDFSYTEIKNAKSEYGIDSKNFDEFHWQPLTPGAYPNGYKSNIKNEAPSVPTNVTATSIPEGLLLKWDDATDDHTPWMQMRYNVSLKIKGKTGENAFVLSPMNGLSDDAAICSGVYYRKASQVIVPKSALVNGTTYELQVQAIDLMGEHSPMTKPVEVTYNAEKFIVINNDEYYTNMLYNGKCANVSNSNFTLDPGVDGVVANRSDDGNFRIEWKTPGVKTITVKDGNDVITKMVNVQLAPDLNIDLPERIMLNTPLTVKVPEGFQIGKFDDFGFKESEAYKATFEMGDTIATIVFKEVDEQKLLPYIKMKNGYSSWKQLKTTVIDETMPTAEIKSIESNGKYYQVNWNTDVPSMVSKVEISRETNRLNQFEILDIVPVGNGSFVDLTSDNRVQPQRYRIRLIADNEMQYSDYSTPHNPLHVMINKTADKQGNNLMWNAYEGLGVQSYIIMRGSSENNLKAIATIAGSQQNYTDYSAPEGVSYYAVKFETVPVASAKGISTYAAPEDVTSNVISSEEAMPTTAATNLYAGTVESNAKLTTDQQELHMVATILPTFVTYNKVSWSIVSGGEYASISQSGLLTAKSGKGDVVVRVVTLDGSNLSDEITIPCDVTILAKDIDVRAAKKSIAVGDYLLLNAVLTPKNTTMSEVTWKSEDTDIATVDENGILKAITPGVVKVTATTKDGSNLSAYINIIVTEPTGINGVVTDDKDADTIYYDLEGRKIQNPTKGNIYITNKGKKVVF